MTRVAVMSLVLLFLLTACGGGGGKVPDVVGQSFADAEATLQDAGLTANVEGSRDGKVDTQTPAAGEPIPDDKVVKLVLKSEGGAGTAEVPDVRGKTIADAKTALESKGFVLGEVTRKVVDKPVDVIVEQSPLPGNALPTGQAVTVTAADDKLVLIPTLKGKSEADAKTLLTGLLEVGTVEKKCLESADPPNTVYESNPKDGDSTVRTNKILLRIKNDCVKVPQVKNLDAIDAIRRIQNTQLLGKLAGTQFNSNVALNEKVASSAPAEGMLIPKGDTVTLTLFTNKPGIKVQDIIKIWKARGRSLEGIEIQNK